MKNLRLANLLWKLSRWMNILSYRVAIASTIAMVILVAIQVVARYGFSAPPQWTEEAARYCMVWAALLGSTVSFYEKADPTISSPPRVFLRLMPRTLVLVRAIAVYLFVLPILWFAPGFLERQSIRITDALEWRMSYIAVIIPIWGAILILHATAEAIAPWREHEFTPKNT